MLARQLTLHAAVVQAQPTLSAAFPEELFIGRKKTVGTLARVNQTATDGQRLRLNQHREILTLAGRIAALIACVEYDSGDRQAAGTTRQAAVSLGTEADNPEIEAWEHQIRGLDSPDDRQLSRRHHHGNRPGSSSCQTQPSRPGSVIVSRVTRHHALQPHTAGPACTLSL
jgi:hypothetical protein